MVDEGQENCHAEENDGDPFQIAEALPVGRLSGWLARLLMEQIALFSGTATVSLIELVRAPRRR